MGSINFSRKFLATLISILVLLTLVVNAAPAQEGDQPQPGNPYPKNPTPEASSETFTPDTPYVVSPDCNLPGNLINNCGFETGDFTGWVTQDLSAPLDPLAIHTAGYSGFFVSAPTEGSYAATTGFDGDGPGTIRVAQDVFLPASSTIELTFDYRAAWNIFSGLSLDRTFSVTIEPSGGGTPIYQTVILTANTGIIVPDTGDLSASVNLSAFAGQAVRISFDWWVPENLTGPAFFQLDNVRLGGEAGFYDNFESGYGNWTATGLWNPETEGEICGAMVAPFPSPSHAAYYGIDGICNFDTGILPNSGSLTMNTPVPLPIGSNYMLAFSSYEETENWCGIFDRRFVEISTNMGSTWNVLGELCTEASWYQPVFDLSSYAGSSILIRFRFDSVDELGNWFFGWMVDDVLIVNSNFPPVLDSIGDQGGDEQTLISFTATASDFDAPPQILTFSLDPGAPAGAGIDPVTGLFSWIPTEAQGPGVFPVTVRVTDDAIPNLSDTETINITVNEVNLAPVLDPIGNKIGDELTEISFTASASDADLPPNTLTYSLDPGAPVGATIDPVSGLFTWTPTETDGPGIYPITVRVTDDGTPNLDDFETFNITVNEVNSAPILTPIGDKSVHVEEVLTFGAWAIDSDIPANSLTFSLDPGSPSGATIDPITGVFYWIPTEVQGPGIYPITVRVTDDGIPNLSDFETINISVTDEVLFLPLMVNSYTQPLACSNLLINSGFEDSTGWEIPATTHPAAYSTVKSHQGIRSMRTGIRSQDPNILSYSSTRQKVTVPADALTATLSVWVYTQSGELTTTASPPQLTLGEPVETQAFASDFQYINVLFENNNLREVLDNQLRNAQTWQKFEFDLSHYIGSGPIKIQFGTYNNGTGGKTLMYVDTVNLEVCMK